MKIEQRIGTGMTGARFLASSRMSLAFWRICFDLADFDAFMEGERTAV